MSKFLEEKKNDLITRAEEVLNKAKAEQRELTEDEAMELAEIRDDIRKIKETLGLEDDLRAEMDAEKKPDAEPQPEDARACGEDQEKRAIEEQERKAFEIGRAHV